MIHCATNPMPIHFAFVSDEIPFHFAINFGMYYRDSELHEVMMMYYAPGLPPLGQIGV